MRWWLAVIGVIAFAAILGALTFTRTTPSRSVAPTVAALVTADPAVAARVDPDRERGRVTRDDRTPHRLATVRGLAVPIDDATLPTDPALLPNAPRDFRAGWHEGIDFPAPAGTPVHAVAAGIVIRVDRDFIDWDLDARNAALDDTMRLGYTPSATLDRIRGRQVWIDHGRGVVSRYAHLSAVADLALGDAVETRAIVGAVGSSGYPEGGPHLHLEIRLGTSYLGDGLAGDELLAAISAAFD